MTFYASAKYVASYCSNLIHSYILLIIEIYSILFPEYSDLYHDQWDMWPDEHVYMAKLR